MSRTTSHRPFRYTEHGRASAELKVLARSGEITYLQMYQVLSAIPFEGKNFSREKPVGQHARSLNRRERYSAKRAIARGQEMAPRYSPRGSAYWLL